MRNQRRAYTLLEVILVCALIVLIMAISLPSTMSAYDHYKWNAASDTIRAAWAGARSHAVEEGRPYRFSYCAGKGTFRVAPDDPAYWSGSPPKNDDKDYFVIEDALPKGGGFHEEGGSGSGDGQWATYAHFEPDGTTHKEGTEAGDTTFDLGPPNHPQLTLTLKAMTGTSTVRRYDGKAVKP